MGGFGWAARTSAEHLARARQVGRRPVLLAGRGGLGSRRPERHESGIPLIRYDDDATRYARRLGRERVGLFLTIDYRPNYLPVLQAREVPTVVWVRDPRAPADLARIATLELPSGIGRPDGVDAIDCRSLSTLVEGDCATGAHVVFASPAPALATPRMHGTYGLRPTVRLLPNPVPPRRGPRGRGRAAAGRLPGAARSDQASLGGRPARSTLTARRVPPARTLALLGPRVVAARAAPDRTSRSSATSTENASGPQSGRHG